MKVIYKTRYSLFLRTTFSFLDKSLSIPGSIFERSNKSKDRYYFAFGGKFNWEADFLPFVYMWENKDIASELFYGIPQLILRQVHEYESSSITKYQTGENRSCSNCVFKMFNTEIWEKYKDRPTSERYDKIPRSFYSCSLTGEAIDQVNVLDKKGIDLKDHSNSLKLNLCNSHIRSAFKVSVDPIHRRDNNIEHWVPAEHRRLRCLNPRSIYHIKGNIYQVGRVRIELIRGD